MMALASSYSGVNTPIPKSFVVYPLFSRDVGNGTLENLNFQG